jgi:hypothetical protein
LRDGAVLALIAAGLNAIQIAGLRASAVHREGHQVLLSFEHSSGCIWMNVLPTELGARLLAWLTEAKIWGLPEPVFRGCRGPLTPMGIFKVFARHRDAQTAPAEKLPEPRKLLLHYQQARRAGHESGPRQGGRPEDPRPRDRPDAQHPERRSGSARPGPGRGTLRRKGSSR